MIQCCHITPPHIYKIILWMVDLVFMIMDTHHFLYKIKIGFYSKVNLYFWRGTNLVKCIHDQQIIQIYNYWTLVYCSSDSIFKGQVIWNYPDYCYVEISHEGIDHTLVGVMFRSVHLYTDYQFHNTRIDVCTWEAT